MNAWQGAILLYAAALSVYAFALFGIDKKAARRSRRRIPEKRLFAASFLGGGFGAWIGMSAWRHKTKHASFRIGVPLLALWNAAALGVLAWLVR
ncbi:DUF1294 domain-containing protein [Paenibacillus albicereus]|uniref:DUF1294 domain-containing protein n=1 Tax=Paenibacillus albicereus TaxID=2726185 RepID=A0A6H2GXN6_9BACL|nr:DUF1294 domain-containing protein [Paenibacillus albicereus]QJC52193.1 DUF1294 domain-containing protein [Paenibacillus albicereus]